jgi:hypothetical protein
LIPAIIIYYVKGKYEKHPGEKIAKSAFVNETDALTFWNALSDSRKKYLVMETKDGEAVTEIAHSGFNNSYGYFGHANALTASKPLPLRTRDRVSAEKSGWKFAQIKDQG